MANEAVIVVGFGVILAFLIIGIFLTYVQRINAPNRADPGGVPVEIDIGTALAEDKRAAVWKMTGDKMKSIAAGEAEVKVTCCNMILPTSSYARAVVRHASSKRKSLRVLMEEGGARWEARWARLSPERRRNLLHSVRGEVLHAVSSYIGKDDLLFSILCPELNIEVLLGEHKGVTGLSRLVQLCLSDRWLDPKTKAYAAVQAALIKAAVERETGSVDAVEATHVGGRGGGCSALVSTSKTVPIGAEKTMDRVRSRAAVKEDLRALRAFPSTFRKLCLCAFSARAIEELGSRDFASRDGRGPTIGSFAVALAKTGGTAVLLYCFFHALQTTSDSVVGGNGWGEVKAGDAKKADDVGVRYSDDALGGSGARNMQPIVGGGEGGVSIGRWGGRGRWDGCLGEFGSGWGECVGGNEVCEVTHLVD